MRLAVPCECHGSDISWVCHLWGLGGPASEAMDALSREEVRQALSALYDNAALSQCSLVRRFPAVAALADPLERALRLRAVLLEAIEALRPARRAAFGSREARACDVLTLRYVERLEIAQLMEELAIGRRQAFRDLRQAEEQLAQILTAWAAGPERGGERRDEEATLSSELSMLASQPVSVNPYLVIEEALALIQPLADRLQVRVRCAWPHDEVAVTCDYSILKQLVTQVLSCAVQSSRRPEIELTTTFLQASFRLSVLFYPKPEFPYKDRLLALRPIADHEGICLDLRSAGDICEVSLLLKRQQPIHVLVVEDNPGAVELYRRYLAGGAWQVRHLSDPRLAFEVARREQPDVLVLDIMMPKMDGWSVLQSLRQRPETANIPILICSVVEDEALSQALGATECLRKPVSQGDFLAALSRCLRARRRQAGHF